MFAASPRLVSTARFFVPASLLLSGCLSLGSVGDFVTTGTAAGGTTGSSGARTGSSGGGSGTSSGGTGTGSGTTGLSFVDGGYVFCTLPDAADAGPDGDGGVASWMCTPGTYLCDLSGDLGNCFQCLSDSDCVNQGLPTYDPRRPRCDLHSGVPGYQNFCQQCLDDADCAGNPAGPLCDLNPEAFPSGSLDPPIVDLGFETCDQVLTDCRLSGGPACKGLNQLCDRDSGECDTRSQSCASDEDCLGLLSTSVANLLEPYCVAGQCRSCPGVQCPNTVCQLDADCADAGMTCNLDLELCGCTSSSQCGGFWPSCGPPDAGTDGTGQPVGICGCDSDQQCGDPALVCLPAITPHGARFCGVPCSSPGFPQCLAEPNSSGAPGYLPICDPGTGLCTACTSDGQCQLATGAGGSTCTDDGTCGCLQDSDCPAGQRCNPGVFLGVCSLGLPRCTPATCKPYFCDWDSGECRNDATAVSKPSCFSDYDCAEAHQGNTFSPFCDQASGQCVQCRSNADCAISGFGDSFCCLPGDALCPSSPNLCTSNCHTDQDCSGSKAGPTCLGDAGLGSCGCGSDSDCAGGSFGDHCDLDRNHGSYGECGCLTQADCPPAQACTLTPGQVGTCGTSCATDGDCQNSYFCDPKGTCRPRCDESHACQGPDPLCDGNNLAGQNGETMGGAVPGVVWCYQCLLPNDCSDPPGCDASSGHVCGICAADSDCPSGDVCGYSGASTACQPSCDAGPCQAGQVCDSENVLGWGDLCYQCLSSIDCPEGEGCNSGSHTCGTCLGPGAAGGPWDCPPGDICSSYWEADRPGVCLQSCDRLSCPASQPICAVLPALTPDHKYCFGCLQDSDCSSLGPGAWCDVSVDLTFSCKLPPTP